MTSEARLDPGMLPPMLAEVADVIGFDLTLRLVDCFGGWRVYVPEQPGQDCELAQVIGLAAAQRLALFCPMQYLAVPACAAALRHKRDAAIRARHAGGERPSDLARAYGITARHVYKIIARAPTLLVSGDN